MSGTERQIVHQDELIKPRARGRFVMSYCPIHGGDHQRSLHINLENGYGKCHSCGADVFCPELAPEGTPWPSQHKRPPTANDLLRPPRRLSTTEAKPEQWQIEELATLTRWYPRTQECLLEEKRAKDYLDKRGIPLDVARDAGVGYIPAKARLPKGMGKWADRLLFPLSSPAGTGFAGRTLWHYETVTDEEQHKLLLDSAQDVPRRWEKTMPAGWFNVGALEHAKCCVIVEGPVDALALIAAGLLDVPVVALVGTAFQAERIPLSVLAAVIALDGDEGGIKAKGELEHELRARGIRVESAIPSAEDGLGKDWAARWRIAQWDGVAPVFDALDALDRLTPPALASVTIVDPPTESAIITETLEALAPLVATLANEVPGMGDRAGLDPWNVDVVVRYLLDRGFTLVEARALDVASAAVPDPVTLW